MDHQLTRTGKAYHCEICLWDWKSKPSTDCPGVPRYDASKAAAGLCYLFHVEYKKEETTYQASIEVSPEGQILQANGPQNWKNPACDYGIQTLSRAFRKDNHRDELH